MGKIRIVVFYDGRKKYECLLSEVFIKQNLYKNSCSAVNSKEINKIVSTKVSSLIQGGPKMSQLVLVRRHQIFTKFDNFWHTNNQDNRIM